MIYIIFILIQPFGDSSYAVNGGTGIMEEPTHNQLVVRNGKQQKQRYTSLSTRKVTVKLLKGKLHANMCITASSKI